MARIAPTAALLWLAAAPLGVAREDVTIRVAPVP